MHTEEYAEVYNKYSKAGNAAMFCASATPSVTWKLNSILIQTANRFNLKLCAGNQKRLNSFCIRISNASWPTVFDICIMKYLNHLAPFSPENWNNFFYRVKRFIYTYCSNKMSTTCILKHYVCRRFLCMIGKRFWGLYFRWTRGILWNKHVKIDKFWTFIPRFSLFLCCQFNYCC